MLYFFVLFAALLTGLLWKTLLTIKLEQNNGMAYLCIELRFLYGFVPLRWERQMESADLSAILTFAQSDPLLRLFLRPKKNSTPEKPKRSRNSFFQWIDGVKLRSLHIDAEVGISGDAYASVILAGSIKIILDSLCCALQIKPLHHIQPNFERNLYRMKLESILEVRITHIMTAALKRQILRIRGRIHAASH